MEHQPTPQLLVVGLPASGKTTFLAALQNYLDSDSELKSIRMLKYSENSEYLNRIHRKWLQFEHQGRTFQEQSANNEVVLHFEVVSSAEAFTLNIPDVAGETFAQQWSDRYWTLTYKEIVEKSSGLLLFIHPLKIQAHAPISQILPKLRDLINLEPELEVAKPSLVDTATEKSGTSWAPESSPTQSIVIDLIQAHVDHMKSFPIPIAIVISAWDIVQVASPLVTPAQWLKINLPLLDQFFVANFEALTFEVFGVSAQGGDLNNKDDISRLLKINNPAERVIVSNGDNVTNDIAAPIISILAKWKAKQR